MIYLVPFDQVQLPFHLPVNSTPDRFLIPMMAVIWLAAMFAGSAKVRPTLRSTLVMKALIVFLAVVAASLVVNLSGLVARAELTTAVKQSTLVASYAAFFYLSVTILRAGELRNFTTLIIALATICSACVIVEYVSGFNVLYWITDHLIPSTVPVNPPPLTTSGGRRAAVGPASIGLTTAAMLAMALPFAVVRFAGAGGRRRIMYAAISALIIVGGLATLKKTAVALPIAGILTLAVYRPRTLPLTMLLSGTLLVAVVVAVPSLTTSYANQLSSSTLLSSDSSQSRTTTLAVEKADIQTRPFLGRGFGSFSAAKYRFTDDQYLLTTIETGFIGLAAYIAVFLAAFATAHRAYRTGRRRHVPDSTSAISLACIGAIVSYIVANALFDSLAFPQDPYVFLFIAAVAVVARDGTGASASSRSQNP
jgi:hypothetical protein